jgi:hypothetical protein
MVCISVTLKFVTEKVDMGSERLADTAEELQAKLSAWVREDEGGQSPQLGHGHLTGVEFIPEDERAEQPVSVGYMHAVQCDELLIEDACHVGRAGWNEHISHARHPRSRVHVVTVRKHAQRSPVAQLVFVTGFNQRTQL